MTLAAAMFALMLGRAGSVERTYDKFRDVTTARQDLGQVGGKGDDITMFLLRSSKGEKVEAIKGDDDVTVAFYSMSESWKFLKFRDVHILADGKRFGASKAGHDGQIRSGGVSELITATVKFADLEAIAASEKVEIAIGSTEFALDRLQVQDLRKFAAEMKLDAAGVAALVRKEAEEKRLRAEREAKEKEERERIAAERAKAEKEAWDAKVAEVYPVARKALIEAKNKGSDADSSIRKSKTKKLVEAAASKLCKDYNLTREELDRLMIEGKDIEEKARKKTPEK